jgi:hypothetical protein
VSYEIAINSFAESHGKLVDFLVGEIKAGGMDPYQALEKHVGDLTKQSEK